MATGSLFGSRVRDYQTIAHGYGASFSAPEWFVWIWCGREAWSDKAGGTLMAVYPCQRHMGVSPAQRLWWEAGA